MNGKDFELIARVIKARKDHIGSAYSELLADDFADALRATNKQFNREKFIRACGGQP